MPRNYKKKGLQTDPKNYGVKNMPSDYVEKNKDVESDGLMGKLIPMFEKGMERRKKGSNWTVEELFDAVKEYFDYSSENDLKPNKSGLRLYLGVSKTQYFAWQTESTKYGEISEIINFANDLMEQQYVNRGEKYPTFNTFLLKASHQYVEKTQVDINTGDNAVKASEINEIVKNLGLDKAND